jgi:DNA mismatch endonuclease (patch repair protein)
MSEDTKTGAPWPDVPALRREIMQANRRRDSGPELALRSALHRAGLRFRVDHPVRPPGRRPTRPDVVFPKHRIAVFVDGCFWHGCPIHGTQPATNREYWAKKIDANRHRDTSTTAALERDGWTVLRFWEHEDPADAVQRVLAAIGRGL